ncbi:MAG: hypothetical protein JRC86_01525 [Deltaproteobacteria bacterium]|nr:hypothetical protein [Deltaproteobacteria bacterium]
MRVVLAAVLAVASIVLPLLLLLHAFETHVLTLIENAAKSVPSGAEGLFPFDETMAFVVQGFLIIFLIMMLVLLLLLSAIVLACLRVDKPYIGGYTYNY